MAIKISGTSVIDDSRNVINAVALTQGNNITRPLAEWSAGGSSTGMVFFELPGTTSNYGMVHMVFDIYEYNGNSVSTVIVGGHNWNGGWYNNGANVIGLTNKPVRLGVRGGKYVVCFGTASSTWEYGTVMLRKIHNASFYNAIMDMKATFVTGITTSESLSFDTGDLRALRTPATFNAVGAITQNGNQVLHAANYNSYSPTLTGTGATGTWNITSNYSNNLTQGFNSNWNTDFQAAPAGSTVLRGDTSTGSGPGGPGGSWWFQQNMRHSNSSNFWGVQVAWGWEDNANILRTRNVQGGNYGSWITYLNSNNYNNYSPTLTGTGASGTWGINITGNSATATTAPSGTNRGDQIHGSSGVTPATSFASIPFGMSGFTDNWSGGDLPSGMNHVHGIAVRHFNNNGNLWGWHIVGQYDIPGDLRVRWVNAGTWTGYYQLLSSSNYNNYSPTLTGGNASGTWNINVSGDLTGTARVLGYSVSGQALAVGGQGGPQVFSQGGGAAMMSFHRPGAYAVNFGLDSDNALKVGGWSMGSSYNIYHSGIFSYSTGVSANHVVQRDSNGYIYANYINFNTSVENGTVTNVWYDNGDGWIRKASKAHFVSQLAITGTPAQNIVTATTQTAAANNHYVMTNAALSTVTLPASPTAGDVVWATFTNGLTTNTIARNGQNIMSLAEDLTVDNPNATIQVRYINSTVGWRLI
jgi:hypothetical protein